MLGLGPLAFVQPWILAALLALPALWLLLRVTPPAPKSVRFPAIRLLKGLEPPEETPARTPLWLLLLRMLAVSLLIVGLAGPVMHPAASLSGSGPLVIVVDNGWASAKHWNERQDTMHALLDRAERDGRRAILLTTAQERPNAPLEAGQPMQPSEARERAMAIRPVPWSSDLARLRDVIAEDLTVSGSAHVVWLSDGLHAQGAENLARDLQRLGRLDIVAPDTGESAMALLPPQRSGQAMALAVHRADPRGALEATAIARDEDGAPIGTARIAFEDGEHEAQARFDLPLELRNRMARVAIEGERHAGAVALLDERWQRRPVGLVSAATAAQPLLSELFYLERALEPFAEIHRGDLDTLLDRDLSVLALGDRGELPTFERQALSEWIEAGGILVRFAGPRMARELTGPEAATDGEAPLLPVRLRHGGRALGGALSWDEPARLAPFAESSPFAGLEIPDEVRVERQVLADPAMDLAAKTWAELSDGTPLVTAEEQGEGWVVLVHTTANTEWSNLALSGLYVEMLRRLLIMGAGVAGDGNADALPPRQTLDGFGQLGSPTGGVRPISMDAMNDNTVTPANPPGLYGREGVRRAHNLGPAVAGNLRTLADMPAGVTRHGFTTQPETRIGPWLLAAALALLLIDMLIALALRGLMPARPARGGAGAGTAGALVLAAGLAGWPGAAYANDDDFALKATLETRLAYVETGVSNVDQATRDGLIGISRVLARRTTVEPADPLAVNLENDEMAFFPLIYWSITPEQADLSREAARNVNDFLRGGGTLIFDLRESRGGGSLLGEATPGREALRRLTRDLDIPPLEPVDPDHVLTKAFYLLQDFPGRHSGGTLWVEDTSEAAGDGVATVIVGQNDWVGAWAVDERGRPRYATAPGGERQREMAYRVGVNIVMYALTGNYKADQVHVPAILERLGQ